MDDRDPLHVNPGFGNVEEATEYYKKLITKNHKDLKDTRTTGFISIDVKLWETRQCLALGLGISTIVMASVTLEDCLKTLIKDKLRVPPGYEMKNLKDMDSKTVKMEQEQSDIPFSKAIGKAHSLEIITDEQKTQLEKIELTIRNPYVHSNTAAILSDEKTVPVREIEVKDEAIETVEEETISSLGLMPGLGIATTLGADDNAPQIFEEIEELIIAIADNYKLI